MFSGYIYLFTSPLQTYFYRAYLPVCVTSTNTCICVQVCVRLSAYLELSSSLAITPYFMVPSAIVDGFIGELIGSIDSCVCQCVF